ncbi:unnamed protein product, partial [marine sediment metagenome]
DYKQYNFSIRKSVWTEQNGFYGTNPFLGAGLTDKSTSIFIRFKLKVPIGAPGGIYNQSNWKVYIGYDTKPWYDTGSVANLAKLAAANFHAHCIIQCNNGDLYVSHYNYSTHGDGGNVSSHRSTDGGVTWVVDSDIWKIGSEAVPYGATGSSLGIAPNGTLVCLLQTRTAYATTNYFGLRFKLSYDNGATWIDKGWLNTTNPNATRHVSSKVVTVDNTMYAPVYTDAWAGARRLFTVYVSDDNGSSWSKKGEVFNTSVNDFSYATITTMANGSFMYYIHHSTNLWNYYSIS